MNNNRRNYQQISTTGLRASTIVVDEFAEKELFKNLEKETPAKQGWVLNALNFRTEPEIKKNNIIRVLEKDATIVVIEDLGEWLKINHEGEEGYVKRIFVGGL